MVRIKRALVSVSDKEKIVEFCRSLRVLGVEIISTGGTASLLRSHDVEVTEVSSYTGFPEMLDGRIKTLHPKIHGALLALRNNARHMETVGEHGIELIDMVVVNLYPFEEVAGRKGVSLEEAIENIDIGGPSMLRSAAKNYRSVAVVSDPARYDQVLGELKKNEGSLREETLRQLAVEAFALTSRYDAAIHAFLRGTLKERPAPELFPPVLSLRFEKEGEVRYGENPHQKAALYRDPFSPGLPGIRKLQGKELSFNNYLDLDAALQLVLEFEEPAAAIVKHNNPCGAAVAPSLEKAFLAAWQADPLSAFGGIVALNRPLDTKTARRIASSGFLECVIARGISQAALAAFSGKKNLRVLDARGLDRDTGVDFKRIPGGLLVQERDSRCLDAKELRPVTRKKPTSAQLKTLLFSWEVAKHVTSNAIVLARGTKTVGIGAGQMSRVDAVMLAVRKAGERSRNSCLASDAFFPKPDSIKEASRAGVVAIIQPGGSIADEEVIAACDRYGISMVFTGVRHFRH